MRHLAFLAVPLLAGCYLDPYTARAVYGEAPADAALTRADIERLVQGGVSDAVILAKARRSGVVRLSTDDLVALKKAGASDALLTGLLAIGPRSAAPPPPVFYALRDAWWEAPAVPSFLPADGVRWTW